MQIDGKRFDCLKYAMMGNENLLRNKVNKCIMNYGIDEICFFRPLYGFYERAAGLFCTAAFWIYG